MKIAPFFYLLIEFDENPFFCPTCETSEAFQIDLPYWNGQSEFFYLVNDIDKLNWMHF